MTDVSAAGAAHAGPGGAPAGAADRAAVFPGASEMAARCRAFDWAATPLGPVAGWPVSLRTTVATLLAARHPMILWYGAEGVQLYNDAYAPVLGPGRHPEALGMRAADCWRGAIWAIVGPQIAGVLATGEATWHDDQYVPLPRRGRVEDTYWTYSYGPAFDDAGRVAGVLAVTQETTARVLAEQARQAHDAALAAERERLRALVLRAPTPMALHEGPEHRYVLVNDAHNQVVGRDVAGLTLREAFPEVAGQGVYELFDQVVATGEPWVGRETLVRFDRQGLGVEDAWFDVRYEPVRDAEGRVTGVLNTSADVTAEVVARREVERLLAAERAARAEAEQERERAMEARGVAEAASRAKGEFLAVMSHELRTPLNAIGGYAQLLELELHGPVTGEQRHVLGRVQAAQTRLLGLINDVLNYAKLEGGRVEYRVEAVDVRAVVAEVTPLVEPQLLAKGLALDLRLPDAPCEVWADREKLGQVLLNLLSNAAKFTDARHPVTGAPGRVAVGVATRADGPDGGRADACFLRVSDTGRGIPRDRQDAIFDPFVQVDQRLTRAGEGTGLGLAISRDLARGMGGDLRVRSAPGEGATFTVALRRAGDR